MKEIQELPIAIDFDGTCVKHQYPLVGDDCPHAVRVMKRILGKGHDIILHTMRGTSNGTLQDAINWFKNNGLYLTGANCNPMQKGWTDSDKIYAKIYIDDAALGCPLIYPKGERPYVDWLKVEEILIEIGVI